MSSTPWHLEQHRARLRLDRFAAAIDLTRPADGLVDFRVEDALVPGAAVLALDVPSPPPGRGDFPVEGYVRGTDLVAVYEEFETWPVRVEALWRAARPRQHDERLAVLELVVSVRTSSLESQPELAVGSGVPADQALRLTAAQPARYDTLAVSVDTPLGIDPEGGPGCLLFRIPGSDLSYAEMVHPVDFQQTSLRRAADDGGLVRAAHRLFPHRLEKGVILRARVRGVWLPREDDARLAAEEYRAFASAEPPLGT